MRGQTRVMRRRKLQAPASPKQSNWPRTEYDRGEDVLAAVLSECLDEMKRNGGDMESALAQHPDAAAEIRPLLEVAAALRAARS